MREVLVWACRALEALFVDGLLVLFLGLEEEGLGEGVERKEVGFVLLGELGSLKMLAACLSKGEQKKGDQHQRQGV